MEVNINFQFFQYAYYYLDAFCFYFRKNAIDIFDILAYSDTKNRKQNTMDKPNSIFNLTQSVFNAMNSRDFSEMERNITDDAAFDFPGVGRIEGGKRVIIFLKALLRKYKELKFTVSEIVEGTDRACAVWTNEGEHINGNPYSNRGITLLWFSEGRINFISDYFKDTSFVENS